MFTHCSTHNVLEALAVGVVSGFLGDDSKEEGILGDPLHWHGKKVFQLQPAALRVGLTPLREKEEGLLCK